MEVTESGSEYSRRVRALVRGDLAPHFGELADEFPSNPYWESLKALGGELWLDTGDIDEIRRMWTREFTALTTNNTLLNREVQKGTYDGLIVRAATLLDQYPEMTEQERKLEFAFILNARHGLKLVELFDAYVSVEEHTDLADDQEGAINYARRLYEICPERFFIKIPFSPAGLLATRRLSREGVPVNHTLGFSARQNYLITRVGRPAFVNVFMGRLNSFVADNGLGEGTYVGERATLASQRAVRRLRRESGLTTRQIGASFREGRQVADLAGLDVATIPSRVAREFLELAVPPAEIADRTGEDYQPALNDDVDPRTVGLHTLWEIDDRLIRCVDELEEQPLDDFTDEALVDFLREHGCGDVLVRWTEEQVNTSAREGKIPRLSNWQDELADGSIGLDSLMNLAGWNSFNSDQVEMDERVREVLTAG